MNDQMMAQATDEQPQRYRWQREDQRYYEALLQRDLFGWVIVRIGGRVGSPLGRVRTTPLVDYRTGRRALDEIARQRVKRGYVLVTGHV